MGATFRLRATKVALPFCIEEKVMLIDGQLAWSFLDLSQEELVYQFCNRE
jgi:hypothetical protein